MRKIALIGTGTSGKDGPFDDESYEIWGVASRFPYVTRADRWFELHRLDGEPQGFQDNWRRAIKTFASDVELFMLYPEADLGSKVRAYPYQHIVDRFGTYFMTSSFAWMLAMAIDELSPEDGSPIKGEIGVWGVDMEYGTEYRQQRAGFRHFVDLARVLGIAVSRFADSGLSFEPVPYPLWQDDPLLNKLEKRKNDNLEKVNQFETSLRHTRTMIAQNQAVIGELSNLPKDNHVARRITELKDELEKLLKTSSELSHDIVHFSAIKTEQDWLEDYLSH